MGKAVGSTPTGTLPRNVSPPCWGPGPFLKVYLALQVPPCPPLWQISPGFSFFPQPFSSLSYGVDTLPIGRWPLPSVHHENWAVSRVDKPLCMYCVSHLTTSPKWQ
jgi:hypothetical protein